MSTIPHTEVFETPNGEKFNATVDFFLKSVLANSDPVGVSRSGDISLSGSTRCILEQIRSDGLAAKFRVDHQVADPRVSARLELQTMIYVTTIYKQPNEVWQDTGVSKKILKLYESRAKSLIEKIGSCMGWTKFETPAE